MSFRRLTAAAAFVAIAAAGCSSFSVAAATVNGRRVTEAQVEEELDRARDDPTLRDLFRRQGDEFRGLARRNILTALIRQAVLEREADRRDVEVTRAEVDELLRREASRLGLDVASFLEQQDLSLEDARLLAERQLRDVELRRLVTRSLRVDDAEVERVYRENPEAYQEVHLLRITTRSRSDAGAAKDALDEGQLFSSVARERSTDDLAAQGGDMGYVPSSELGADLQTVVQRTAVDGVTEPLQAAGGFEIYKVLDKRTRRLADVREQIADQILQQQRATRFESWLAERLRRAKIVVNPKYGRFDRAELQVLPAPRELPA